MYIPKAHEETDIAVLHALIRAHPLAALVVSADGDLCANHLPLVLDPTRGQFGTLMGHVARANDVWKLFSDPINSVILFQGSESYITPSWYPSKHAGGKAVPTWNYVVVHAHGRPRAIEDRAWLLDHLHHLTDTHEAGQVLPWKVGDAPADYIERMLAAIVGIEIPIDKLVGKWKVSQNRALPDKLGVIGGLLERGDDQSKAMAAVVSQHAGIGKIG